MSESNTITVTAETVEQPAGEDTSSEQSKQPATSSATAALIMALIAIGLAIGLSVAAYFMWIEMQQLRGSQSSATAQIEDRIQPLRSSLDDVSQTVQASLGAMSQTLLSERRQIDQQLREQRQQYDQTIDRLGEDQHNLGRRVSALAALMGRGEQGWNLTEVEYLLRIANQRLQLQRDLETAEQALQTAYQRLQDLADPRFISVREQIAKDLDAVQAVPAADIEGISLNLTAALDSVDQLAIAGSHYQPVTKTESKTEEPGPTIRDWRELPKMLWSTLSDLFRIREHGKPVSPMLAPEREYYLRENLRLQLFAARLALLRDDEVQYQTTLRTTRDWLRAYFAPDDVNVNKLVEQIEELQAINIVPDLPDVSGSLRLLHRQMKISDQQTGTTLLPDQPLPGAIEQAIERTQEESRRGPES